MRVYRYVDISYARNPIVLLGLVPLLATGASLLVADAPVTAALIQAVLSVVVGLILIGYGLSIDEAMSPFFRRRIVKLIGAATGVFFVLGAWFGLLSRTFETSYLVAIVTSLVTGAALGALLGVYSARLGRANSHGSADVVEDGGLDVVRIGPLETAEGFYVADNGQGIDPDDPDAVFESGYSTSADGTGFGLTIVSRIAEAQDWMVTATESESGGARFEIRDVSVVD